MMRSMKSAGQEEVARLRNRTRRLLAANRIFPADAQYITTRLDEIEARIAEMWEANEYGKEEV